MVIFQIKEVETEGLDMFNFITCSLSLFELTWIFCLHSRQPGAKGRRCRSAVAAFVVFFLQPWPYARSFLGGLFGNLNDLF